MMAAPLASVPSRALTGAPVGTRHLVVRHIRPAVSGQEHGEGAVTTISDRCDDRVPARLRHSDRECSRGRARTKRSLERIRCADDDGEGAQGAVSAAAAHVAQVP